MIPSSGSVSIGTLDNRYEDNINLLKIRDFYVNQDARYIDSIVLAVCSQLKGEKICFHITGREYGTVKHGKIVAVKGNKVHLWEGYHKRRLDIKNLLIYHPSVYAALSCI